MAKIKQEMLDNHELIYRSVQTEEENELDDNVNYYQNMSLSEHVRSIRDANQKDCKPKIKQQEKSFTQEQEVRMITIFLKQSEINNETDCKQNENVKISCVIENSAFGFIWLGRKKLQLFIYFHCVTFNFNQFQNYSMQNMKPNPFSKDEPPPQMIYITFDVSTVAI